MNGEVQTHRDLEGTLSYVSLYASACLSVVSARDSENLV